MHPFFFGLAHVPVHFIRCVFCHENNDPACTVSSGPSLPLDQPDLGWYSFIKDYHVSRWNIEPFFTNRCGDQHLERTFTKPGECGYLLFLGEPLVSILCSLTDKTLARDPVLCQVINKEPDSVPVRRKDNNAAFRVQFQLFPDEPQRN